MTLDEPEPGRGRPQRRRAERDDRPLLDDIDFIEDEGFDADDTDEVQLAPPPPKTRKPPPRKPSSPKKPPQPPDKLDYIPLDDL
jgi:hypothetical protein